MFVDDGKIRKRFFGQLLPCMIGRIIKNQSDMCIIKNNVLIEYSDIFDMFDVFERKSGAIKGFDFFRF